MVFAANPNLALIGLLPLCGVLAWLYWTFPRSLTRRGTRRRFDGAVLLLALSAGFLGMRWSLLRASLDAGAIAKPALVAAIACGTFVAVLALGAWLRALLFRDANGKG
ncbi:MAG: hypothetical protein COW59_09375 [Lysobacterales bacterium CG17_big_fil_post_rev_8_21_14_2_50_64_11]|nr:MAG: hypothetical protein COW59_09375 [Xanthomonadales bacterium CG17_big_fil_post_rev_8_21_14_2_50_64_11]PIX60179.1 MAG: hypothetical protein COZ47_08565 [Xanthomonadales bacterium CG_4_10_14_3_um_filter_64_11]